MFPVRVRWGWFSIVWKARHGQSRPAGNGQRKSSCTCPWPRITGSARGGRGLSGPCPARRWRPPSHPKAGKLAPAQFSHRSPRQAACRKSDLWLPLLIPIRGHVDLPGISDRAVYAAFSATFWSSAFFFFLSFCCRRPQPSTPARAWPCRLSPCRRPAGSWVTRPSWASPCCGLLGRPRWRAVPLGPARPFGVDAGEWGLRRGCTRAGPAPRPGARNFSETGAVFCAGERAWRCPAAPGLGAFPGCWTRWRMLAPLASLWFRLLSSSHAASRAVLTP